MDRSELYLSHLSIKWGLHCSLLLIVVLYLRKGFKVVPDPFQESILLVLILINFFNMVTELSKHEVSKSDISDGPVIVSNEFLDQFELRGNLVFENLSSPLKLIGVKHSYYLFKYLIDDCSNHSHLDTISE